jgi:hypothetical protein
LLNIDKCVIMLFMNGLRSRGNFPGVRELFRPAVAGAIAGTVIVGSYVGLRISEAVFEEESHAVGPAPTEKLKLDSFRYEYEGHGGHWDVMCFDLSNGHRVRAGESLSMIANKVINASGAALGEQRLPEEAILEAIAEHNSIEDLNHIEIGDKLQLPSRCEVGPVR